MGRVYARDGMGSPNTKGASNLTIGMTRDCLICLRSGGREEFGCIDRRMTTSDTSTVSKWTRVSLPRTEVADLVREGRTT